MSTLTYPSFERWIASPFWQRWRNDDGKRIRLDNGERLNDDECCCGEYYQCANCSSGNILTELSVTFSGFVNTPYTFLNATFVIPISPLSTCSGAESWTAFNPVDNPCGPGQLGGGICFFVTGAQLRVTAAMVGGVTDGSPTYYGKWFFSKTFAGRPDCFGTHSLNTTAFGSGVFAPPAQTCANPSGGTTFRCCDEVFRAETPSCTVSF